MDNKTQAECFMLGRKACESGSMMIPIQDKALHPYLKGMLTEQDCRESGNRLFYWHLGYLTKALADGRILDNKFFAMCLRGMFSLPSENIQKWTEQAESQSSRETLLAAMVSIREQYGEDTACRTAGMQVSPSTLISAAKMHAEGHSEQEVMEAYQKNHLRQESGNLSENQFGDFVDSVFFPKVDRICGRCSSQVNLTAVPEDYSYQCRECDEDLFEFETQPMKGMQL